MILEAEPAVQQVERKEISFAATFDHLKFGSDGIPRVSGEFCET